MALRLGLTLLLLATTTMMAESYSASSSDWGMVSRFGNDGLSALESCNGSNLGDCVDIEEETMLDSEASRRVLAQARRYISYAALKKNSVPCNRRGASYYSNCASRRRANPYNRGCSRITRCKRYTDI